MVKVNKTVTVCTGTQLCFLVGSWHTNIHRDTQRYEKRLKFTDAPERGHKKLVLNIYELFGVGNSFQIGV